MVERFLQAAAGDMQLQVLHERRRIHSVPTSEPTEACPLAFAGQPAPVPHPDCPDDLPEANCLPERCRMPAAPVDWTHNGIFQTEIPPRLESRGVLFFPSWAHDVSEECRGALGTRLTKSKPANR